MRRALLETFIVGCFSVACQTKEAPPPPAAAVATPTPPPTVAAVPAPAAPAVQPEAEMRPSSAAKPGSASHA